MLNKRLKHYKVAQQNDFQQNLKAKLKDEWIDKFDTSTFSFKSGIPDKSKTGATIENLKLIEMGSSFVNDPELGEKT
jgi:hypothetical protein